MKFRRDDGGAGVLLRQNSCFATGRGTAVQDALTPAEQQRDQLRAFVLNREALVTKCAGTSDVSGSNCVRLVEQSAGLKLDGFRRQLFNQSFVSADGCLRRGLVIAACGLHGFDAIGPLPSLYEPSWMRPERVLV